MKRTRKLAAALAAITILTAPALAASVTIDGAPLRASAHIANARIYVPVRAFYETLGCTVSWDASARAAVIAGPAGETITIREGRYGVADGDAWIPSDTANHIRDGRLYAPIRPVAASLDYEVAWQDGTAQLTSPGGDAALGYSQEELAWLARIIYAEAGGESMEGMIAVGNTILNRVASDDYPDTIYGVIFDRKYAVQYEPVLNGTIYNDPSAEALEAARRCLEGESVVGESLFFLNPRKATNFWIVENREFLRTIGNHDFYL